MSRRTVASSTASWAGLAAASALALLSAGCGVDPIDVSGPWSGSHSLIITGAETSSGQEGIQVSQRGNELTFFFAGCNVKAVATSDDVFDVQGFDCQKQANLQTWRLRGGRGSQINASTSTFSMVITGSARSGDEDRSFNWSFTGNR